MPSQQGTISVQYQVLRKGANRPEDWGASHGVDLDGWSDVAALPHVGDYVNLQSYGDGGCQDQNYHGKVRSRLFGQFTEMDSDGHTLKATVGITIVVEETDDDWGKLIKE